MQKNKYDIIIIGAGPAGLLSALKLKEKGYSIAVFEKQNSIGERAICGGACDYKTIKHIADKLHSLKTINEIKIFFNYKKYFQWKIPKVSLFDRKEFDRVLYNEVQSNGIEVFLKSEIKQITKQENLFKIICNKKEYICKYIVVATGPFNSILQNKNIGFSLKHRYAIAGRVLYDNISEYKNKFEFYFSNKYSGYNWIFSNNLHVNIGHGVFYKKYKNIRKEFHIFMKHIKLKSFNSINYSIIPLEISSKLAIDNIAFIGDAAGMVNPVTGGGLRAIYYFSDILVKAIEKNEKNNKTLSFYYNRMCKRTLIYWFFRITSRMVSIKEFECILFILQFLIIRIRLTI